MPMHVQVHWHLYPERVVQFAEQTKAPSLVKSLENLLAGQFWPEYSPVAEAEVTSLQL